MNNALIARRRGIVLVGGEGAALIALGDRIFWLALLRGEDRCGVRLRIVLRPVAQAIGVLIVVPRALVARDAIDDLESDVRVFEPDADKLGVIAWGDPDRQAPAGDRLLPEIAN